MKIRHWISLTLACSAAQFVCTAGAQGMPGAEAEQIRPAAASRVASALFKIRPPKRHASALHELVSDLERSGYVNRSLPRPYRVAVPLVQFGEQGPKLMITYARTLPGAGAQGVLLFLTIPLP